MNSSLTYDTVDDDISKAARHLAKAVAKLRDSGDNEYAAILQSHLHGFERPHWLSNGAQKSPILPPVPRRIY